jgi:hypothetical protein
MNHTDHPPLEWTQNTGGWRRLVEAEAIVPIGRGSYLTIGADLDETGAVPEALAALPEVQAALIAQGWRAPEAGPEVAPSLTKAWQSLKVGSVYRINEHGAVYLFATKDGIASLNLPFGNGYGMCILCDSSQVGRVPGVLRVLLHRARAEAMRDALAEAA